MDADITRLTGEIRSLQGDLKIRDAEAARLRVEKITYYERAANLQAVVARLADENAHYAAGQAASQEAADIEREALRAELARLKAWEAEFENAAKFSREEGCGDEKHCACVPILRDENRRLRGLLERVLGAIENLMQESTGVVGLHLNGDIATWNSLTEGQFGNWLEAISTARAALDGHTEERP